MERFLMEYLANSLWQAPMIAAAAWLILRVARPAPLTQHRMWVGALALMVALPAFSARSAESAKVVATPIATPAATAMPVAEEGAVTTLPMAADLHSEANKPMALVDSGSPITPTITPRVEKKPSTSWLPMREIQLSVAATHWLVGLYLAAIVFMTVRLLCSWWSARRVVARGRPAVLSEAQVEMLDHCCARFGVKRPKVLFSASTCSPMVVGLVDPVLLLPEGLAGRMDELREGSERELEAVWLHELAHVRRRDYLANLVCRVAALPVAYHPATHFVQQRIRRTREMVCDAMAAAEMQSAPGYARCLVGLAREMQANQMTGQVAGAAMFDGGVLEERVMQLIKVKTAVSLRMQIARAAACVAILAAVTAAAATFHVSPMIARVVGIDAGVPNAIQAAASPAAPAAPMQLAGVADSAVPAPAQAMASAAAPMAAAQAVSPATPEAAAKPADASSPAAASLPVAASPAAQSSEGMLEAIAEGRRNVEEAKRRKEDAIAAYSDVLARQIRAQAAANGKPPSLDLTPQLQEAKRLADDADRAYSDANRAFDDLIAKTTASARASEATREFLVKQLAEASTQLEVQAPNTDALRQEADELAKEIARQQALSSQLASVNPEMKKQLEMLKGEMAETLSNYAIQLRKNEELKQTIGKLQVQFEQAERAEEQSQQNDARRSVTFTPLRVTVPHDGLTVSIPALNQQRADAAKAMAEVQANSTSAEDLAKQLSDVAAKLNSPEFKKQMAVRLGSVQRQLENAQTQLNNPKYAQQMQALAQMQAAQKANSPEFKKQMEQLNRAMSDMQAKVNSPEFKQKMQKLDPEVKAEMEQMQKQLEETLKVWSAPAAK